MSRNLRKSVVSTSLWAVLGFGLAQFIRLIGNIFLAAMLYEEAFALMAICIALQQGLIMLSDLGFNVSIIQNKRGLTPEFLNTVWSLQISRGFLISLTSVLLAVPIAHFYVGDGPAYFQLVVLICLLSLSNLIASFESTNVHIATRELNISRITVIQILAQILNVATMVVTAYFTQSVYSLAVGTIASSLFLLICSHKLLDGPKNAIRWEWWVVKEVLNYGKWIFISTAIYFLTLQLDKLIFAKTFDLSLVGVYVIALNLAMVSEQVIERLVNSAVFPTFTKTLNEGGDVLPVLNRSKKYCYLFGALITSVLVGCGHSFIHLVYDERYAMAGVFVPILSFGTWVIVIESVYGSLLLAYGKSSWMAAANLAKVVLFILILFPAVMLYGFIGAVLSVAVSNIGKLVVTTIGLGQIDVRLSIIELKYTIHIVAVVVLSYYIPRWLQEGEYLVTTTTFFLQGLIVLLVFLPSIYKAILEIRMDA